MFLQKTLTTYEDWPKAMVTKQTYSECAFILRGTDRGRPAWHCILVPASQIADLNAHPQNTTADITKFGSIIQYLNNRDQIILTSGWGIDPPRMIQEWIEEHYSYSVREIRLGTYTTGGRVSMRPYLVGEPEPEREKRAIVSYNYEDPDEKLLPFDDRIIDIDLSFKDYDTKKLLFSGVLQLYFI
ncbi:unnamed protein product [Rotaria sp. Silwood1]|nr:unnamed protein product [Rotaria sp. Silwood1]